MFLLHTRDRDDPCVVPSAGVAVVQQLASRYQLPPGGRRPSGAWVYYPDGYETDVASFGGKNVTGAFLVDSFFQFHVDERTWDYYMGRMLLHLWKETGHVYMAVCAGGSALCKPSGGGLKYSQLLAELPSGWMSLLYHLRQRLLQDG